MKRGRKYSCGYHSNVSRRMYQITDTSSLRTPGFYDVIRDKLGVKFSSDRMPPELSGTFFIDGIKFDVLSAYEKTSLIRIYITCPECGHCFAAGRAGQHICKPKHEARKHAPRKLAFLTGLE